VCKYWRQIIHKNQDDDLFHRVLWFGSIQKFAYGFEWKHLPLIPDEYLRIALNIEPKEMDKEEFITYKTILNPDYNETEDDVLSMDMGTNVPLLIAILIKCPKIYSMRLTGLLCEDLFFAIGLHCEGLRGLTFAYCKADNAWLERLLCNNFKINDTLWDLHVERSYWCDDETMAYFGECKNLANVSSEKWQVSGFGLRYLFEGCTNLLSITLDRYIDARGEWEEAFKCLAEKNKKIVSIDFNDCRGFNDDCLAHLMEPTACPKLEELCIHYHGCSEEMIEKFKEKRTKVSISGCNS